MRKRALAVTMAVGLGFGMLAASATAGVLSVTVSPAQVHPGGRYTITISGRYASHRRTPYLFAFIQYSGKPCQSTATSEYALPSSGWSWDFYPPRAEPSSHFQSVQGWSAGPRLGVRRVCVYLYAGKISPGSTTKPLVVVSVAFRNAKAPVAKR